MNIIQIIPGSGGSFYCGNCLRDSKFYEAIRIQNHSVLKVPMYLPLFENEDIPNDIPVFYGAISVYLKQNFRIFKNAPAWFDKLLNSKPMLKLAARMSGSTEAKGLEDMTISMLLGEEGEQKQELEKMVDWLAENCKPDVIHISNALLLGLAKKLKQALNVPLVCSLQDEDVWVDVMEESHRRKVWSLMSEKASDIDAFVSVSDYFAEVSIDRMNLPTEKIHTIHLGIDPKDYHFKNSGNKPRNIGFISRMCASNGLDILVEAFIDLKKISDYKDVKLIITGGSTGADKKFIRNIRATIRKNKLENDVEFLNEFDGSARIDFFDKVSVISVPVRKGEAFGIYLIEAMASGVPVIQPNLGAFPEIVLSSNGGLIYKENTAEQLSKALKSVFRNPAQLSDLSINARKSAEKDFNINTQAKRLIDIYRNLKN